MPEPEVLSRGARGPAVARLQRLLARQGFHTRADGKFGPATAAALRAFQQAAGLAVDGIAGVLTWAALSGAVIPAPRPAVPDASPGVPRVAGELGLPAATLGIALGELAAGAREHGGNNRGRFVRKYMGVEGLPWCVGFATWCYREACARLDVKPQLTERWSSSRLVREARALVLTVDPQGCPPDSLALLRPGHLFVLRGGPTGFSHTGIVRTLGWAADGSRPEAQPSSTKPRLEYITTVEGNTRLRGEAAPDCVVTRYRATSALVLVTF